MFDLDRELKGHDGKYPPNQVEHLLTGCNFFDGYGRPRGGPSDDATWRAAWEDLREELLPKFIAKYPGHRPWAWWRYDSPPPHRRRRIGAKPHPFDNHERKVHIERLTLQRPTANEIGSQLYELWFGKPASVIGLDDIQAEYESERDFLERHGLLTDAERAALGARAPQLSLVAVVEIVLRLAMFAGGTYFYGFCARHSHGNDLSLMALGAGLLVAGIIPWPTALFYRQPARA
jgi:hypothetical protein